MTSCPIHKYTELCNGNHLWYRYINLMVHVLTRFYLIFPKIGITHVSWWAKSNTVVSISSKVQWGYRPVSNSIWDSRTPSTCLGWEWATVRSRAWRPDIGRLDLGSSMWSTSSSTEAGQAELEGCQSQKTQVLHNLHTPVGYNFFFQRYPLSLPEFILEIFTLMYFAKFDQNAQGLFLCIIFAYQLKHLSIFKEFVW